jgi:hypothetical protein
MKTIQDTLYAGYRFPTEIIGYLVWLYFRFPYPKNPRGALMFAILRGANGRRHEVDFDDDPVTIDVAMSSTTVQVTMTAADPGDAARGRFVTIAVPP